MQFRNDTNPNHKAFYVSAIDGRRIGRFAGPYASREEAEAAVHTIRLMAEDIEPRAHWWAWGTTSLPEHDGKTMPLALPKPPSPFKCHRAA